MSHPDPSSGIVPEELFQETADALAREQEQGAAPLLPHEALGKTLPLASLRHIPVSAPPRTSTKAVIRLVSAALRGQRSPSHFP
jgi:hypothetical protein